MEKQISFFEVRYIILGAYEEGERYTVGSGTLKFL